ncbi:MAG TPA: NDP-sugar synthase [Vicinamibacteria bacterium]|nr:NDP-sugar synthase [Vicinamibacteria bacterium]
MESNAVPRDHGIVLAGAYPDGQCPLDRLVPRPLLPVAQQPLVTYALRWMASGGLRSATICANAEARAIRASLEGSAFGLRVDYLEDWSPRGAAGCVRDAGLKTGARTFVVADGTTVPVVDLGELLECHHASRAAMTVVVGADGTGRLRPSGIYVFDRRAFEHIPEDGFQDIKEKLIPRLHAVGETVSTHMAEGVVPRVVNADSYLAMNQWVVERTSRHRQAPDGFRSLGETVLHDSASVDPTARLLGPVLLGPGVSVEAGAILVGPVSIGRGTTVGRDAVVSRSVVWSDCQVGDRSFVDRSMLADRAVVEPGTVVISAMRTDERRSEALGTTRSARSPLAPILAVLSPATPHQG